MKKLILAIVLSGALAAPTVTLDQNRDTVFFGGTVAFSGQITPAAADQKVTITQTRQGHVPFSVTVTTDSAGLFHFNSSPRFNTRVVAKYTSSGQTGSSDELNVFVRPRVSLSKYAANRYAVRVLAARSFVGDYVWVTRWKARAHAWST
jgi:hypothetical protein